MSAARRGKLRVIFVGAFATNVAGGAAGGVMSASQGLLASPLGEHVEFILLDTTGLSVPPPPVVIRAARASLRVVRFAWLLAFARADLAYVLTSDGTSFIEKGLMTLLARAAGVAVVLNPRSGLIPDDMERSKWFRWFVPFVLERASVVLCQGETWRRFFASVAPRARTAVVKNWVSIPATPSEAHERAVAQGTLRVLYMGWIERFKGIFDLLEACQLLRDDGIALDLVVCGGGRGAAEAAAHAKQLGIEAYVTFVGWVGGADKADQLRRADVYVHPSHREGMPNSLLEAMAYGVPSIAADAGAVSDVITDDRFGRVVEAGNPRALADALREYALSPAKRGEIARASRERISEEFSVEAAWPKVLAVFESLRKSG